MRTHVIRYPQMITKNYAANRAALRLSSAAKRSEKTVLFCGAAVVLQDSKKVEPHLPFDAVLPAECPKDKAKDAVRGWVKGLWFAPTVFKKLGLRAALKGVYLPFFTFDSETSTTYRGQRGDAYWETVRRNNRSERRRRVRWSSASGNVHVNFDDVLVQALENEHYTFINRLGPWPTQRVKHYQEEYLAGFLTHRYDIGLDQSYRIAQGLMQNKIDQSIRRDIGGDEQRISHKDTRYDAVKYKLCLLPVWLMSYQWKAKTHRVAVNAINGKVIGSRPYSTIKIASAVVVGIAIVLLLYVLSQR